MPPDIFKLILYFCILDMDAKLSIIIPVYKVKDTLDRCVDSIMKQDYTPMEVILVDDGSPDEWPRICDKWAAGDSRIKVIHKSNGGLSDARNAGIDNARGEYITFVDSDDYLDEGTLSILMRTMESCPETDLLEYPVYRFYGSPRQSIFMPERRTYHSTDEYWLYGEAYSHSYAWNKIYRRTVFNGVRFPKGKVFEDVYTLPEILQNVNVAVTVECGMYFYCHNQNGITNKAGGKELQMLLEAHMNVIDRFVGKPHFDKYYMHVVNIQLSLCEITGCEPALKRIRIKSFKGMPANTRVKAAAINILGIKTLCRLFKAMKKTGVLR